MSEFDDDDDAREAEPATTPWEGGWRHRLGSAVARRATYLQEASNRDSARAVARLAQLRRAVGMPPGSVAEAWEDTIGVVPDDLLGRGEEPSTAELAAHHALTLFAFHRRGRAKEAHRPGRGLGEAVRLLSRHRASGEQDEDEGVRRRFDALVTASTPDEGAHHLRGLVLMLRDADVGLDYGRLAGDLAGLWAPSLRDGVRLRWARQYRHIRRRADDADDATETTTTTEESA